MSRMQKRLRNIAIAVVAIGSLLVLSTLVVVRTNWFRETVRQRIVAATEEATGGKVTLGSFDFDLSHLRATVTGFVLHGKEAAGTAPFLRVDKVQVDLRLFTSFRHLVDISYLGVEKPQANIVVYPDGTTNIPIPKAKSGPPGESPLATVVDLAVGHFQVSNGLAEFNHRKQEIDLRGNNLRALLNWNILKQHYEGQVSLEPLYLISGRNTPVTFQVTVPAVVERDRVIIHDARITTPRSDLLVNMSVENMKAPRTSAHINGHVALADLKNAANLPIYPAAKGVPAVVDLDANATFSGDTLQLKGLRATVGKSNIEASGTSDALELKSTLALGEIGRLTGLSFRPDGQLLLNARAKLDAAYNIQADGNVQARNVSVTQDGQSYRNINLTSALHLDPHHLDLRGLHLSALGGEFIGNAGIEDLARYSVDGNLHNLDLQQILRQVAPKEMPHYAGILSGAINASGDIRTPGLKSIVASTRLSLAPGGHDIPVGGRINADYRGSHDEITLNDSFVSFPHSKLTLAGSVGKQLDVTLTSTDLNDFLAGSPVKLNRGRAAFTGAVTGSVTAPHITGHLAADRFSVEGRQFDSAQADVAISKSQAAVNQGVLTRAAMRANFDGTLGLSDWNATSMDRVTANIVLRNGDLADLLVLAGEQPAGYSGAVNADAHITGTLGDPQGSASIQAANGQLDGEVFDQLQARVNLTDQRITLPAAYITSGPSRVDFSGDYQHPSDDLTIGRLHAHAQSSQFDLSRIKMLQKLQPNTSGTAQVNADIAGNLGATFLLTAVNGSASLHGLHVQGQNYGNLTASAHTTGTTVTYQADSDFSGAEVRVNGRTDLATDYPTTADATLRNLQIAPVLLAVQQSGIPAQGALSGTVHVSGTVEKPQGNADLDLAHARIYDEPLDHVHLKAAYLANAIDLQQFEIVSGPSKIDVTARYDHRPADLESGTLRFRVNSGLIDMARIHNLQKLRPGVGGRLEISGDGAANVRAPIHGAGPRVLFTSLNANINAKGVSAEGSQYGDLVLNAKTAAADHLNFTLRSDLATSSINGSGTAQLSGDYPVNAELSFKNVTWSKLAPLVAPSTGRQPSFEGVVDGQVTVNGPALNTNQLRGTINLSRLNVSSIPRPGSGMKPVGVQNDGTVQVNLDNGLFRLQNVKFSGPKSTIQAGGTASLANLNLNLTVSANADLALLQNFSQDIDSAGSVVMATTVRGSITKPLINGTLDLHSARFHYATLANGISNANGTIVFNGNSASIRNLSAETGGGTIVASGFVGYAETVRLGLRATASHARIQLQEGVSAVANADIRLSGTTERSLVSGTVTVDTISYRPQSDIGSILSRAAPRVEAPSAPSPLLDNMRLDVRVRTSPALAVQASLAQNLQADADLRIRGTITQPGVLGRVNISEGKLVFFGSTFTVNSGNIGFYNPVRIDPILDISLETQSRGVDVVLHVTGPIDNMKLSYTSDPPLQFQEIVALLAAGTTPTSDPTLLANQPSQPQQNFQQMGESALVSKALADPVSSRLQRVFGVSQLKIDPAFTNGTQLPQARVTLQQQISSNITFTYVSALNDPNTTVIRVEWAFNPQWSAVASRDENGIFSVNFFYKRQFR
jgi:translocation and assembly module TamB